MRCHVAAAAALTVLMPIALQTSAFTQGAQAPAGAGPAAAGQSGPAAPAQLGVLAPANLSKPRPKPPFDLTGLWLHGGGANNNFRFSPPEGFKLTPAAQVHYDAARKAQAEGRPYRDDIGQCWPAGMPVIMTRVWPIAMVQLPTAIFMTSEFMNSFRIVYLDGRGHSEPDVVVPSHNGESIGRWEGDTLVIDTIGYEPNASGIAMSVPSSSGKHTIERLTLTEDRTRLRYEITVEDPTYLSAPGTLTQQWDHRPDLEFSPAGEACNPDVAKRYLENN